MGHNNHNNINLKILAWNCDGISGKITELIDYLHKENIPIALIGETKLTPTRKIYTPGYVCHRNDRKGVGTGQGTLILVRSDVKHQLINLPALQAMEATAIKIFIDQKPLILVGPYLTPSKRIATADLDAIARLGESILMAGDFNSKHLQYTYQQKW